MACRSRSRSPVEDSFTHSVDGLLYLDGEIDFEFPMLTDEDIDCIVQDMSDAHGAPLGSIEKPFAIDAIQKHVEESLLFLDEEKSENKTGSAEQKINFVLEKSGSDDTIMQDIDDSSNTGDPLKKSAVILKQENINDASLFDEQQKDKSEIESITTENKVDTLLEHVKQETSNIPEQMETNDVILSLEDNPISDSVLNKKDKDTMNYLEETSGISEQSDTVRVVISQEDNPSDRVVNETDTDAVVMVALEEKSEISLLTYSKKANIVSLEHNPTSDSVLNEINKDTAMDNSQEETSDISEQIDTSKVIVLQENNPPSDTDTVVNVSLEQESEISQLTDGKNAIIVSREDNPPSDSVLIQVDKDADINDPQEETSGTSEQIDNSKFNVSQTDNPSDSAIHEMDPNAVVKVSLEQESEISQLTDGKNAIIVSREDNPPSDSVLIQVDKDADINDQTSGISEQIDNSKFNVSQTDNPSDSAIHEMDTNAVVSVSLYQKSEIPQLIDSKKANIESLEDNPTSDSVLNEINTDAMNSENKPSKLLGQSDSNKACNALQDNNPSSLSTLNETDTDATIYDSEHKSSAKSEQSDASKFCKASEENNSSSDIMLNETDTDAEVINVKEKTSDISIVLQEGFSRSDSLLDETDADVTMNYDSQEELGDNSKHMITNEISNVSPEQKSPSDSLLNKTDLDANMDETQECISDIPQQTEEMDGSNYSIVPQEENHTSEVLLEDADTVAAISSPQEETSDILETIDCNEISNISQVDNNILNETDADGAMRDSLEIPEQIEIQKVDKIYKYRVLNETNTDVTSNDSQEEISDISELIYSKEVGMVSQENLSYDSLLNKTDIDEALNDTQEEINDTKTYNIDDSNISEKDNGPLDMELDKTDVVLHEGCETDNTTIETAGNGQDSLKSIKKEDHKNSVTEPQKDRILTESKEINNQPDEPTQGVNTTREDNEHDKLPELESYVEKSGLPENETQVKKTMNKAQEAHKQTEQATQKLQEKELVWEIKSINNEPEEQTKKEQLQKEEQNDTENPTKENPLVRAAPTEDVAECLPAKRPRFQPIWTTNPLNDEDEPKAEQATCSSKSDNTAIEAANDTTAKGAPVNPYIISQEAKKQLQTWVLKSGIVHPKEKLKWYMFRLVSMARFNKAVLRMAPIPKNYKPMDVFRVIRDQTEAYEKDITKNIQFIHIDKHDDIFNAAYIKWRDIDKLLVVKAYQILVSFYYVDGVVKQPLFKYDDRSIIDWNENDRPIKQKDGDMEIPKTVSTPALTPVVTPIATVAVTTSATPVAKPVAAPVAKPVAPTVASPVPTPSRRLPPPPAFTNGEMNVKNRQSFGLSNAFMDYHNLKSPIVCFVFVKNLDMSHSVEIYHRIFSSAGEIVEIEVMPPPRHEEQLSLKLRIAFNHALEAVQAVSMFHEKILHNRVIEVEIGHITMKKRPFSIEGFKAVGPGLGLNGFIMKNVRSNIELSKLRARTKVQMDNLKGQISSLRQKLSAATFKLEQAKRDEDKRRYKVEKKQLQSQNESQNKQASMDAVNAITTAIASSVQANVMGMLGIQPNKHDQNIKQNTPSAPVNNQPVGIPQSQDTSRAPVNWIANENATALENQNTPGPSSMENAFQNLGRELHGYQNPLDPYSYYANMQQTYAQYGYTMDPTLMQAYVQPGVSYMQPGIANVQPVPAIANVQPVPAIETSNMPPKTQSMPTIISNQPLPPKPSDPTQSKVHTQSKTIFPPLPTSNKNLTVYEVQKPPPRFDAPPANVGYKTTATSRFDMPPAKVRQTTAAESKVPEIPLPIPTISQPAVKTAFKIQKPIVPPKVTKPVSINMKIPSVLPETNPLLVQNPRTQDKNSVHRKFMKLSGKLPAEPWINKQIREMRKNSKSPERIRKSPEKIKSPDRSQMPKAIQPPRTVRRMSRSPERRGISRSPVRRKSRSPIRRRSRSTERRRVSRSPKRRMSRSPIRRWSRSPLRRRSRSIERKRISRSPVRINSRSPLRRRSTERRRMSRSPKRRMSRSPKRRISRSPIRRKSRSPTRRVSRSPKRGLSRSPIRRKSKSPIRRRSRSPKRRISRSRISKSPIRRKSRSPVRRIGKSPLGKISRSPVRRISRSPVLRVGRSPVRRMSKSPVRLSMPASEIGKGDSRSRSSELGPKPTPRPAYEPDGANRHKTNLDHGDRTANFNYNREMERALANTSVTFSFLPPSVTTADLTDKMSEIGELLEVRAFGMSNAMVVFKFRHDAETCIEMYNMAKVDGQTIEVRWASIE